MTKGIEETLEAINFIKDLAGAIEAAKVDGKLDIFDVVQILRISPSLVSAVKGSGDIRLELSDLNGEEKDLVLKEVQEAIYKFVEAIT